MATAPERMAQANPQRSGRRLWAFGFGWLGVMLLILAGWLAMSRIDRLLHWSRADAEVQRSEVYLTNPGKSKKAWGAAVTIRYVANGQLVETTVVRGFQTGIRPWMESWTRQYPSGSHKRIVFDPASPLEADLDGEWSVVTFSLPIGFALAAFFLLWG
jgi:hypothetical protein